MRVLIVEDQQTLRQTIGRRLGARGYGVDEVGDGESAERMLAVV